MGSFGVIYEFGGFVIDTNTRKATCSGADLLASARTFDLLCLLLANRHRVVSRNELLKRFWPSSPVNTGTLPQAVLSLRKLLKEKPGSESWIATVRGVGYRFVGSVTERPSRTPSNADTSQRLTVAEATDAHRVEALMRQAWVAWIQLDDDQLDEAVRGLKSRELCGKDPRARILALVWESAVFRRMNRMQAAWEALGHAERLLLNHESALARLELHRGRAVFYIRYASEREAIAELLLAHKYAEQLGTPVDIAHVAYMLAVRFGHAGDAAACSEWADRTLSVVPVCGYPWFHAQCVAGLSGIWLFLGDQAVAQRGDQERANLYWQRAQLLLDDVDGIQGLDVNAISIPGISHFIRGNAALVAAKLDPAARQDSIATLQSMLAREMRSQFRLDLCWGLAVLCRDDGRLDEARQYCEEGLHLTETSKVRQRGDELLDVAADVATRQGRAADAVRHLRQLLRWRAESAEAEAVMAAKVVALRLKTEQFIAAAHAATALVKQVEADRDEASRAIQTGPAAQGSGALSQEDFSSWGRAVWTEARWSHTPFHAWILAIIQAPKGGGPDPQRPQHGLEHAALMVERGLAAGLRDTDRLTKLGEGQFVVAMRGLLPNAVIQTQRRLNDLVGAVLREAVDDGSLTLRMTLIDLNDAADFNAAWESIRST